MAALAASYSRVLASHTCIIMQSDPECEAWWLWCSLDACGASCQPAHENVQVLGAVLQIALRSGIPREPTQFEHAAVHLLHRWARFRRLASGTTAYHGRRRAEGSLAGRMSEDTWLQESVLEFFRVSRVGWPSLPSVTLWKPRAPPAEVNEVDAKISPLHGYASTHCALRAPRRGAPQACAPFESLRMQRIGSAASARFWPHDMHC